MKSIAKKDIVSGKIRVRMAPSPTGNLHLGTARTTLFNFLFAKKYGGEFILRIEDTDKERSKKEFEENILEGLSWLGLKYDEFYRQSERINIYKAYLEKLIKDGSAYVSKETPKEEGEREEVIRFKNPRKKIKFDDLIRGEVEVDTTDLGDFVIAKSKEEPLYHLAVVIDDFQMGITHIIRGEDHISNTPRQILIQEALSAPRPIYAHLPLILDPDRKKLSKRKHGEKVWIDTYRKEGYIPDAIVNFLALLGWNPGDDSEIFTLEDLKSVFSIDGFQKSGAVFDEVKLLWINKEHLKRLPKEQVDMEIQKKINERFKDASIHPKIFELLTERISVFGELDKLIADGEFDYFFEEPEIDIVKLAWKGSTKETAKKHLEKILTFLPEIDFTSEENIKEKIFPYADKEGRGEVLWPLRFALSGKDKSPDPFTLIFILGKEETQRRIQSTIDKL